MEQSNFNLKQYWYELLFCSTGPMGIKAYEHDLLVGEDVILNLRRHLQELRDCEG